MSWLGPTDSPGGKSAGRAHSAEDVREIKRKDDIFLAKVHGQVIQADLPLN